MTVSHEVNVVVDRILFLAFFLQVLSPVFLLVKEQAVGLDQLVVDQR